MSLPKNFQQTVNLNKRVEALNDLTFYLFEYDVILTDKIVEEIYSKDFDEFEPIALLGEVKFLGKKKAECKNRVSALDKEKSEEKFKELMNKAIEGGIVKEYEIKNVTEKTFADELDEKNLTELLNLKRD